MKNIKINLVRTYYFFRQIINALISNLQYVYALVAKKKILILDASIHKNGNFGDDLNLYILKIILPKDVSIILRPNGKLKFLFLGIKKIHLKFIGSILKGDLSKSVILGSGVIEEHIHLYGEPEKIVSIRGPLTQKLLPKNLDFSHVTYGDPALIIPKIYKRKQIKKYEFGFIPHYIDKKDPLTSKFIDEFGFHFIDVQDNVESVINEILKCKRIISSSLHGIIVSDAFEIDSRWVKITSNVVGEGFKFRDYFHSVGRKKMEPYLVSENTTKNNIINLFNDKENFNFDIEGYFTLILDTINEMVK